MVLGTAFAGGLWSLIWGIASFEDISVDKQHATRLQVFDIVLGSLYMGALAVELLGMAGAYLQRLAVIRIYAFLSLGTAVIIIATGLIRVVVHFVFKSTLIDECTALATGDTIDERFGIWGPTTTTTLDGGDANQLCSDSWSHDSFSELAWFFVSSVLALIFATVAFAYYRQMLDPTSPANAARAPSAQARAAMYPAHYNPPYVPDLPYGGERFAPPPGPPPPRQDQYAPPYDAAKLPVYSKGGYEEAGEGSKKGDPFADFDGQSSETDVGRHV